MSKLFTIENEFLSVSISAQGAELMSIKSKNGIEYLWQGDPAYWSDRSPVLFPYVGRLTEGTYTLDGQAYQMQIHGLALYLPFAAVFQEAASIAFRLESDPQTRRQYPRDFSFTVRYRLEGPALFIDYIVESKDEKTMYFGLGGHPGFRVPLEDGKDFSDYRLRFSEPCDPIRLGFSPTCFRNGADTPFPLDSGSILPLRHDLFDEDAIVLKDMGRCITLEAPEGKHSVTVRFPQMPYLGLWHMPKTDAPYVCIEPWCSLPACQDEIMALETQPDLICLQPKECYRNTWSIHIV